MPQQSPASCQHRHLWQGKAAFAGGDTATGDVPSRPQTISAPERLAAPLQSRLGALSWAGSQAAAHCQPPHCWRLQDEHGYRQQWQPMPDSGAGLHRAAPPPVQYIITGVSLSRPWRWAGTGEGVASVGVSWKWSCSSRVVCCFLKLVVRKSLLCKTSPTMMLGWHGTRQGCSMQPAAHLRRFAQHCHRHGLHGPFCDQVQPVH